jgi:hypothetical protein
MNKVVFPLDPASPGTPDLPGIYLWLIAGEVAYVGKYTHGKRPLKAYARNVAGLLAGRLYHGGHGHYRDIHKALAAAVRDGQEIMVRIAENVPDYAARSAREAELIAEYRSAGLARCNATP